MTGRTVPQTSCRAAPCGSPAPAHLLEGCLRSCAAIASAPRRPAGVQALQLPPLDRWTSQLQLLLLLLLLDCWTLQPLPQLLLSLDHWTLQLQLPLLPLERWTLHQMTQLLLLPLDSWPSQLPMLLPLPSPSPSLLLLPLLLLLPFSVQPACRACVRMGRGLLPLWPLPVHVAAAVELPRAWQDCAAARKTSWPKPVAGPCANEGLGTGSNAAKGVAM